MSEFTQNKTAGVFATILIGLIILAFMFTGYQTMQGGSPTSVGTVAGMAIKPEEYQQEYNRQLEFYKQIMGGEISAKQIESLKIKESVIRNIVQRKLMSKLAKDLGTFPADEEVKNEIKTLPYFQTNNQFDVKRYKDLLAANRLTPVEFEADVIEQLRMKQMQTLTQHFPLSKGYLNDMQKFRDNRLNAEVVQVSKNSLRQFVEVSKEELAKFLSVETNLKRVESMFKERKEALNRPEEVTARHILLMTGGKNEAEVQAQIEKIAKEVTPANFGKLADKYTEDPSGKGKGGDLGNFARGRMVPEFEQVAFSQKVGTISAPVKTPYGYHLIYVEKKSPAIVAELGQFKEKFATEIIQKDKVEEVKKITVEIANNLRKALEANNEKEVKTLTDKYKLQYTKSSINRLDGLSNDTYLTSANMKTIFSTDNTKPQLHTFDDGQNIIMVKTSPGASIPDLNEKAKADADNSSLKNVLAKKMMDGIMKQLEADNKVKINNNLIQM